MGLENIKKREKELCHILLSGLLDLSRVNVLEPEVTDRLCIVSFYITGLHHNLIVRLLDDKFGIQSRGGCSCAGTYGHTLLNVDKTMSKSIVKQINNGDLTNKPGWVRVSLHPTNTNDEAKFIVEAINQISQHAEEWKNEYTFVPHKGDFEREIAA